MQIRIPNPRSVAELSAYTRAARDINYLLTALSRFHPTTSRRVSGSRVKTMRPVQTSLPPRLEDV